MEIAKNKEVQEKARADVKRAVAEYGWTYEAFNEMKYLDQCAHEGLRMYPSVPFLDRRARVDYNVSISIVTTSSYSYLATGSIVFSSYNSNKNFTKIVFFRFPELTW